ncbi:hypothetical protein J6590_069537 [Homalodisca vitripennis]|nr:hypothetical protein J6590_069537 [Homalodisca vitripennis]
MALEWFRSKGLIQKPFVIREVDSAGNEKFSGYCVDLLEEIRKLIGFEYEIYIAPDNEFGTMDEQGQWNGIIRELIEKRAEIGLTSLFVTAERENVIDYTVPYYDLVGITILMKKPKSPTSLFKFLTVLESDVWLCILGAYFFTSFLMWAFDRYSPYSYQNNRDKYKYDDEQREFNLRECLWFCMTSLTPQISNKEAALTAYYSLFQTHLTYGLAVWGSGSATNFQRVLVIQKKAIKALAGLKPKARNLFALHTHRLTLYEKKPSYCGAIFFNRLPHALQQLPKKNLKTALTTWLLARSIYTVKEFLDWRSQ